MRFPDVWHLSKVPIDPDVVALSRDQFASAAHILFKQLFPQGWEQEGACLHWTYVGCMLARMSGRRSILQAGSMAWPIRPDEEKGDTHFCYEWSPHEPRSAERIIRWALPEVHIWVGLPDTQEIIDLSTAHLRTLAEKRHGLQWKTADPPRYLWSRADSLPPGVHYRPHPEAISYVLTMLEHNAKNL